MKVTAPPLDQAVVGTAIGAARAPVSVARRVAPVAHDLPAYLSKGGLAIVGLVERPVAAVTGTGLAALRRWGPRRSGASGRANSSRS